MAPEGWGCWSWSRGGERCCHCCPGNGVPQLEGHEEGNVPAFLSSREKGEKEKGCLMKALWQEMAGGRGSPGTGEGAASPSGLMRQHVAMALSSVMEMR